MDIKVPRLADGVTTGTIVNIFVKPGDTVKKGQDIFELETEKAVAAVPSTADGVVSQIVVSPGKQVSVGQTVIVLGGAGNATASKSESVASQAPSVPVQQNAPIRQEPQRIVTLPQQPSSKENPFGQIYQSKSGFAPPASPSLRKMAKELGIDLTRVRGSEHGGRIVLEDVKNYISALQSFAAQPAQLTAASLANQSPAIVSKPAESIDFSKWGEVEKSPMTNLRKKISQRMLESSTTIPHVTQFADADVTHLQELRKKYAAAFEKKGGRLTLTVLLIQALLVVLKKYPVFNSSIDDAKQEIVIKKYFNLGIAVDTEQGLIVPVIKNADKKNAFELSVALNELAEKTRARKVGLEDLQGGTFTISNQGGIGGAHFTPIINKPEVAILGLGQSSLKPIVDENQKIKIGNILPLTLSYDHRLIDGGTAARFTKELILSIESFSEDSLKKEIAGPSHTASNSKSSKPEKVLASKGKSKR